MEHLQIRAARRVAEQPIGDRLDGKQADTAETVIYQALVDAGLSYQEATKILGAYGWSRFNSGYQGARDAFTAVDRGLAAAKEV